MNPIKFITHSRLSYAWKWVVLSFLITALLLVVALGFYTVFPEIFQQDTYSQWWVYAVGVITMAGLVGMSVGFLLMLRDIFKKR